MGGDGEIGMISDLEISINFNTLDEEYPDSMYGYWRQTLSNTAWDIYDILVTVAGQEGQFTTSLQRLTKQMGISKNRFFNAISELEDYGFVQVVEH